MQGLIQILTCCLPADDRQIWNVEQGEDDLPVHHCLLYLGLWHHHPLPILPGCSTLIQMSTLLVSRSETLWRCSATLLNSNLAAISLQGSALECFCQSHSFHSSQAFFFNYLVISVLAKYCCVQNLSMYVEGDCDHWLYLQVPAKTAPTG